MKLIGKIGMARKNQIARDGEGYDVISGQLTVLAEGYDKGKWQEVIVKDGEVFEKEPEPLTFERIRKECEPMKHLLVDNHGDKRLYLGFNRRGFLVTDWSTGHYCADWEEYKIKDWKIEKYEGE
jgi:hypothetical protein